MLSAGAAVGGQHVDVSLDVREYDCTQCPALAEAYVKKTEMTLPEIQALFKHVPETLVYTSHFRMVAEGSEGYWGSFNLQTATVEAHTWLRLVPAQDGPWDATMQFSLFIDRVCRGSVSKPNRSDALKVAKFGSGDDHTDYCFPSIETGDNGKKVLRVVYLHFSEPSSEADAPGQKAAPPVPGR
jgi:hypothetical protein